MSDWRDDPILRPTFCALERDCWASVVDQEGRILTYDLRQKEFVRELVKVMNENSERLEAAWRKDVGSRHNKEEEE